MRPPPSSCHATSDPPDPSDFRCCPAMNRPRRGPWCRAFAMYPSGLTRPDRPTCISAWGFAAKVILPNEIEESSNGAASRLSRRLSSALFRRSEALPEQRPPLKAILRPPAKGIPERRRSETPPFLGFRHKGFQTGLQDSQDYREGNHPRLCSTVDGSPEWAPVVWGAGYPGNPVNPAILSGIPLCRNPSGGRGAGSMRRAARINPCGPGMTHPAPMCYHVP